MHASSSFPPAYAIPEKALRRWVKERLQPQSRGDGGVVYAFRLSGSTCNNVPLEVLMSVAIDAQGRIESAMARPAEHDRGCDRMCNALDGSQDFFECDGRCEEAVGLTLGEAAFRDWRPEPSGCFCTHGNRRHKWRNVFQALHYAVTHADGGAFRVAAV